MTTDPERIAQIKAEHDDYLRSIVRQELASLGGHLLAQADKPVTSADPNPARRLSEQRTLAMLGGYLLQHYGPDAEMAGDVADYDAAKADDGPRLTSDEVRAELGLHDQEPG